MTQTMAARTAAPSGSGETITTATKAQLAAGVVAGPLFVVVAAAQALTRDGFDLRRHPASLLSNGDLGWIQISSFVVTGLLVVSAAVGMRRVLRTGRGRTWAPRLVGGYGLGLVAAGAFRADPMDGFPVGTPAGAPDTVSWHGVLHFVSGGVGFLALIAACLVFARRFAAHGERGWAAYSAATGVLFFAAFFGIASGSKAAGVTIAFGVAVVLGWAWISVTAARLRTRVDA